MPVYRFRCDSCLQEEDVLLPISERDIIRFHSCGSPMKRLFTTFHFTLPLTGKDKVLKTLNKEDGADFPGGKKHRQRYEQAMAKGLNSERTVIGIGF